MFYAEQVIACCDGKVLSVTAYALSVYKHLSHVSSLRTIWSCCLAAALLQALR